MGVPRLDLAGLVFDDQLGAFALGLGTELLWRHLVEVGSLDGKGRPVPALDAWSRAETRAAGLRANLGLSPRAFSQLVKALGESGGDGNALGKLKAEGRRIIEQTRRIPLGARLLDAGRAGAIMKGIDE